MTVSAKAIPYEGNDYYPLPADYDDLTSEGQRLARINGTRQWIVHEMSAPDVRARAMQYSVDLFDHCYLRRQTDDDGSIILEPA